MRNPIQTFDGEELLRASGRIAQAMYETGPHTLSRGRFPLAKLREFYRRSGVDEIFTKDLEAIRSDGLVDIDLHAPLFGKAHSCLSPRIPTWKW